jgi:hypothetical protein
MPVSIRSTGAKMQAVLAALAEGAAPQLDAEAAARIRGGERPYSERDGPVWTVDLDFTNTVRLRQWFDARREHATEEAPKRLLDPHRGQGLRVVQIGAPPRMLSCPRRWTSQLSV